MREWVASREREMEEGKEGGGASLNGDRMKGNTICKRVRVIGNERKFYKDSKKEKRSGRRKLEGRKETKDSDDNKGRRMKGERKI